MIPEESDEDLPLTVQGDGTSQGTQKISSLTQPSMIPLMTQ